LTQIWVETLVVVLFVYCFMNTTNSDTHFTYWFYILDSLVEKKAYSDQAEQPACLSLETNTEV